MGVFSRIRDALSSEPRIKVHVIIQGRIGAGWYDIDRKLALPEGSTLAALLEHGENNGIPFTEVLESSPHLRHTLMHNGERCPVEDNRDRVLADGDEVFLLAPIAGG